ncbi:prolipoprotein diacylglyceryl transferase family protein [Desulfarculus baarsii]
MNALLFVLGLAALCGGLLFWACRHLPGERWQFLASVPLAKEPGGAWRGLNITYYGFFSATAYATAAALLVLMLRAAGVSDLGVAAFVLPLLSACAPASRLVARWVEHKPATFTVGGASFVGLIIAPWLCLLAAYCLPGGAGLNVTTALAALLTAYAVGEGLGRLACISFGCCYGKPLDQCPAWAQRLMAGRGFVFHGHTKKIAYESGWEDRPVFPIQAITSIVLTGCGLICLYMFLLGLHQYVVWLAVTVTGLWRFFSETLRSDYRGESKISVYQWMALATIPYGLAMPLIFGPGAAAPPSLAVGLAALWRPEMLLALQGLWLGAMLYMGRSRTTASTLCFHVVQSEL